MKIQVAIGSQRLQATIPGNDLAFYYGDQSYHPGIVIIGRLDGDAAGRIADMQGAITATVEAHAG